jgi:hypothetical protein
MIFRVCFDVISPDGFLYSIYMAGGLDYLNLRQFGCFNRIIIAGMNNASLFQTSLFA